MMIKRYFARIGRRGGESRSVRKIEAAKRNIVKAIAARREKRLQKNIENNT